MQYLETAGNVSQGQVDTRNDSLDMVNDIDGTQRGRVLVGLRFEDVEIPADAEISNAYIQFTADAANSGPVTFTIEGQKSNEAPTFNDETPSGLLSPQNVSDRERTDASVSWSPPAWAANAAGEAQQTADVSSILEEIIALGGWNPDDNGVVFIVSGDKTTDQNQVRIAKGFGSRNANAGEVAQLVVTYASESDGGDDGDDDDDTPDPAINSVSIDQEAPKVQTGNTIKLTATVDAEGGANESVTWRSNNQNVAIVSNDGTVTGEAEGTATITATSVFDASRSDSVEVKVTAAPVPKYQLTLEVDGNGTVTSEPEGINCGDDCTEDFDENTSVTLTATPDSGATFNGWSGACTGTLPCVVTMDANRTVTATFEGDGTPDPAVNSVSIDQDAPSVQVDENITLTATVDTTGGADTSVVWKSVDTNVATIKR